MVCHFRLVELPGGQCNKPWPADFEGNFQPGNEISQLKDGRLIISSIAQLLIFNPDNRLFTTMRHPAGRQLKMLGPLRDGTICVRTTRKDNPSYYHLEVFDGRGFRHFLEPDASWNLGSDLSFVMQTEGGDLWLGGGSGLGVYHEGSKQFESFGPPQGFI